MTYNVICTKTNNGILESADINVKGATFNIKRMYSRTGNPTKIFKFNKIISFVDNDYSKPVEVGWDTSVSGLQKIGNELGLIYVPSNLFTGNVKQHYVEK